MYAVFVAENDTKHLAPLVVFGNSKIIVVKRPAHRLRRFSLPVSSSILLPTSCICPASTTLRFLRIPSLARLKLRDRSLMRTVLSRTINSFCYCSPLPSTPAKTKQIVQPPCSEPKSAARSKLFSNQQNANSNLSDTFCAKYRAEEQPFLQLFWDFPERQCNENTQNNVTRGTEAGGAQTTGNIVKKIALSNKGRRSPLGGRV